MAKDLLKPRTLIEYIPEVKYDPGFPGTPAQPARTVWGQKSVRYQVPASAMTSVFYFTDPRTGVQRSVNNYSEVPPGMRGSMRVIWTTPLDQLRSLLGEPRLSAAQAHYSDLWGVSFLPNQLVGEVATYLAPLQWSGAYVDRTVPASTTYPAVPAVPAIPPTKGSPARSVYDMHLGWNASAQSVRELEPGWSGYVDFSVGKVVGAVVGFSETQDVRDGVRTSFGDIKYGLVFGDGQIRVRENGATGRVVATATGNDEVSATVLGGRTIEWYINGEFAHRSSVRLANDYVLNAVLYAGNDAVLSPIFEEYEVFQTEVQLTLEPLAIDAYMGEELGFDLSLKAMNLQASQSAQAQFRLALPPVRSKIDGFGRATLDLRHLAVSASSQKNNANGHLTSAPMLVEAEVEGGEGAWIPSYAIATLGMLPVIMAGEAMVGQVMELELALPQLRVMSSQNAYGEMRAAMPPVEIRAYMEAITRVVHALEALGASPSMEPTAYISLAISERVGTTGAPSIAAVVMTAQAQEMISAQDEAQLTAHMVAAMMEQIGLAEKATALTFRVIGGVPTLLDEGPAWVVNTDTSASTRYENYSFNSFAVVGGRQFGVRKDGVYLLQGADDAGQAIEAGVALGKHDCGTQVLKHIEAVYAGVSATGQLFLRIGDGKNQYTYQARRVDADMRTQRFDPGRGLRASYFTFDLMSSDGEFELNNITFGVVPTKRSI